MCWYLILSLTLLSFVNFVKLEDLEVEVLFSENTEECSVLEEGSGELKPCQFPFIYKNVTYYGCTLKDSTGDLDTQTGKPWCSTKIDPLDYEHITNGDHYGDCLMEECPSAKAGEDAQNYFLNVSTSKSLSSCNDFE